MLLELSVPLARHSLQLTTILTGTSYRGTPPLPLVWVHVLTSHVTEYMHYEIKVGT